MKRKVIALVIGLLAILGVAVAGLAQASGDRSSQTPKQTVETDDGRGNEASEAGEAGEAEDADEPGDVDRPEDEANDD
jgi:hypothetical protein